MPTRSVLPRPWQHPLLAVLALYFLLAGSYSISTPLFEAPDAYYHFAVIEHIARTGERPPREDVSGQPWRQMAHHAPLYHMMAAVLIAPVDTHDFLSRYPLNPHAQVGEPSARDNINFVAHVGDPWRHTGLAARIVRGFSLILGAVTVGGVYALGRGVFPRRPRLAIIAALVVTLNPQFLFISGAINNDNLVTALSTMSLAWLVFMMRRGITWGRLLTLAIMLAAGALAKASGLVLYPAAIAGLSWVCWRDRVPVARVLLYGAIGLAVFGLIAGWWYLENWQKFGDLTATGQIAEATGTRSTTADANELRGLYYSFWGIFGWFNIQAPGAFYAWSGVMLAVAGVGTVWRLMQSAFSHTIDRAIAGVMVLYTLLVIAGWWQFNTLVEAGQGRLWFPLLGVVGCALAWGWTTWGQRWVSAVMLGPLAVAAVMFPYVLIAPVYTSSPLVATEAWEPPIGAVSIPFREPWEDDSCMLLWVVPPTWDYDGASPGVPIMLEVAWEAQCRFSGYWSVFVHFSDLAQESCNAGDTRHILAQIDSMPDGGRTPVPAIRPGFVLEDRLQIMPPDDIDLSQDWHLQVGLYDAGGTFIRAFIEPDDASLIAEGSPVQPGRCSPELVNVQILRDGVTPAP